MSGRIPVILFQLAFVCLTTGLLYSRFMISLGMIFFLLSALYPSERKNRLAGFFSNRYYLSVTIIFILFALSGLWSENTDYFLNRMRIKLPFLFLPYAFYAAPRLEWPKMKRLILFFIGLIVFSVLWSVGLFLQDLSYYIEIYGKGQILPTPIHHIRYSILVSLAVLFAIYLILKPRENSPRAEKFILCGTVVLLTLYLHVLAVRSGLMTVYILFFYLALYFASRKAYRRRAIQLSVIMLLLFVGSILFVPTIKNKIGYMYYSLELFEKNENIRDLSDSRRLGSIYAGLSLTAQHPFLGVGIGDIMDETDRYLGTHYPELTDLELLPHNQYILGSASLGIPLAVVFILCTIIPVFYMGAHKAFLLPASQLMFFGTFMVEHTIESQIGVAVYIFILLFSMKLQESSGPEA